jgi:hypothetical protein
MIEQALAVPVGDNISAPTENRHNTINSSRVTVYTGKQDISLQVVKSAPKSGCI